MRKIVMAAALAAALTLSACTDSSEAYPVGVSQAWSKVSGSGYSAGSFALPTGLLANQVRASFESFPGDRTGYWKFTRNGRELGRLNIAVEGDETSSTISYSYAKGDVAEEDKKVEQAIRQYSPTLVAEAIDASIENRARDDSFKRHADVQSMAALSGNVLKTANGMMAQAAENQKMAIKQIEGTVAHATAKQNSTRPTTDLSGY